MALKVPKANNTPLFKDGYKVRNHNFNIRICSDGLGPSKCLGLRMQFFETSRLSQNYPNWSEQVSVPMVRDLPLVLWEVSTDGATGRNKLVINHLGKLFVTSDAATIIREIEVVHPAAKLLVMASQAQESEVSYIRLIYYTQRKPLA
jgi:hypothetical protein